MAILIPSKNIYDKKNPKIRDNVIERIEVGAVEVVPNNEYETTVYNKKLSVESDLIKNTPMANTDTDGSYWGSSAGGYSATRISGSYVGYLNQKTIIINVKIPVVEKNKYINYLFTKVDKEGSANIKYSLSGIKKQGTATAQWDYKVVSTVAQITEGDISYSYPTSVSPEQSFEFPQEISISENSDSAGQVSSSAKQSLVEWGNIKTASSRIETIDGQEYYAIDLEIMGGLTVVKMTSYSFTNGSSDTYVPPTKLSFSGTYEIYEPTALDITFYGNTIGIELTDKMVYINGETAKKVHSVDGNELMQDTNYYVIYENPIEVDVGGELGSSADTAYYELFGTDLNVGQILHYNNEEAEITELPEETGDPYRIRIKPNGEWAKATTKTITAYLSKNTKNAIIENYQKTQNDYEKGKENATIRCSISDYFDYSSKEKVIAIDNSTGKMSFKLYDQVIPMVYGADGKDRPMSTYQDGTPKVFQVLGSNIYYDGAIWQELSLQEI